MTTKTKYQVWGYEPKRGDFTLDGGEYDSLDDAKSATCSYENSYIEQYDVVYDEDGAIEDAVNHRIVYLAFDSDESEKFFERNFPYIFR